MVILHSVHVSFANSGCYNAVMQKEKHKHILNLLNQAGLSIDQMAQYMEQRGMGKAAEFKRALETGDASACSDATRQAAFNFAQSNPQLVQQMQQVLSQQ